MTFRLLISEKDYVLSVRLDKVWVERARLQGGASALLPAHGEVTDYHLEVAIQRAEDWISPCVLSMRGEVLEVADDTGRLIDGLHVVLAADERVWPVEAVEERFRSVVDLATGRFVPEALKTRSAFIADLLLVREIAHHGRVSEILLTG
ncbi:MAG: hypothetical protein ACKOXU_01550 [Limnohabitans sp.]